MDLYPPERKRAGEDKIGAARRRRLFLFAEGLSYMTQAAKRLQYHQPALPFDRSKSPLQRSELRGTTAALKETFLQVLDRGEFDDVSVWVPKEDVPSIEFVAQKVGVYSEESIALRTQDPEKARLWIAMKLLEVFQMQRDIKGKIENPDLQKIIYSLERYKVTGAKDSAVESREVHVALPLLSQMQLESLAEFAPVFLAFSVALNAKLFLNVQGAAPRGLEQNFLDAAKRNGITLASGQFRVFGVAGSEGNLFKSLNEPGVREDVLLAGEAKALPENRRATLWYNSPKAQVDMVVLASEITEALYAALDSKTSKGSRRNISEHFKELTAAIANAIQASLKILKSA